MNTTILVLLLFAHFLADFTHLSTSWMLNAKRLGKPLNPILAHAFVHALLVLVLLSFWLRGFELAALFGLQLTTHFIIDVWKGRMNGWFPSLQSPANKWHWVVFGFDQFLHGVVIVIIANIASIN